MLVLLSHRQKYKCAKCSRLYYQKPIEDREFREWNEKQRNINKNELKRKRNRDWNKDNKDYRKEYYRKNKEKIKQKANEHYYNKKDHILAHKRIYRQHSKDKYNEWRREYRNIKKERIRLLTRISFWRDKQKKLALRMLENKLYNGYIPVLDT